MTDLETKMLNILRDLAYHGSETTHALCNHPDKPVRQVVGDASEKGEGLEPLCRALTAARRLIYELNGDKEGLAFLDERAGA